jgi:hypothetical protein
MTAYAQETMTRPGPHKCRLNARGPLRGTKGHARARWRSRARFVLRDREVKF